MKSKNLSEPKIGSPMYRVLVVEDDIDTRASISDILELDGYTVTCLGSGSELLSQCDLDGNIAIILDRHLPDAEADDLLPKLGQLATGVPLVILTGDADLDGTIVALRHGAADYLLKPINADCLRASLNRMRQLRSAQRRAADAERLAAIGQAVATVAHESRNDLQRIAGRVELLKALHADDAALLEDLRVIENANHSLKCLFEELREYSGPIRLELRCTRVKDLIRRAWENVQVLPSSVAASIRFDIDNSEIIGDSFRLEQVFRNLLENSLGASHGEPRIEIHAHRTMLDGRHAVEIVFRDFGTGFNDDQCEKAFEPFFTTKPKGTGLGLAICKRIIEMHNGRIRIDRSVSDGAAIVVTLPIAFQQCYACEGVTTSINNGRLVPL